MEGSKDQLDELNQIETEFDQILPPVTEEPSEYIKLLEKLRKKELRLSYSALKAFSKSPRDFIKYKLDKRKPKNDGMIFGSLCDCLLTEPHKFEELFAVVDKAPTTDNQVKFCNDVLDEYSVQDAYKRNYKTGNADNTYAILKDYIDASASGKTIITPSVKEEAEKVIENLKKSDLVMMYLDTCSDFQVKTEWKFRGWNFLGYKDAVGDGMIIDLKYNKDSNPDKFEREIMTLKYYMQFAMYTEELDHIPECIIICYDKSGNFSVIKLDFSLIHYGIREYHYLVEKLEQCIKHNKWHESYNFFDFDKIRTIYKPKWLKGFETDVE
jgi:hypothetical protein